MHTLKTVPHPCWLSDSSEIPRIICFIHDETIGHTARWPGFEFRSVHIANERNKKNLNNFFSVEIRLSADVYIYLNILRGLVLIWVGFSLIPDGPYIVQIFIYPFIGYLGPFCRAGSGYIKVYYGWSVSQVNL